MTRSRAHNGDRQHGGRSRAGRVLLVLVLLVCHAGCAHWFWPGAQPAGLPPVVPVARYRVLILPVENRSPFPMASDVIGAALQSELQASGAFEVVLADAVYPIPPGGWGSAEYAEVLQQIVPRQRPDLLVLCTVTEYRPYAPMTLGLSLRLVSAVNASTLAAVDSVWEAPTQVDERRPGGPLLWTDTAPVAIDPGTIAHSPRQFARAVAAEIAVHLAGAVAPAYPGPETMPPAPLSPGMTPSEMMPPSGPMPSATSYPVTPGAEYYPPPPMFPPYQTIPPYPTMPPYQTFPPGGPIGSGW